MKANETMSAISEESPVKTEPEISHSPDDAKQFFNVTVSTSSETVDYGKRNTQSLQQIVQLVVNDQVQNENAIKALKRKNDDLTLKNDSLKKKKKSMLRLPIPDSEEMRELKTKYKSSKKANEHLESKNRRLSKQLSSIEKQNAEQLYEIRKLKETNASLNKSLDSTVNIFTETVNILQTQNTTLEMEKRELLAMYKRLNEETHLVVLKENSQLKSENQELKTKNEKLAQDLTEKNNGMKMLMSKEKDLLAKYTSLKGELEMVNNLYSGEVTSRDRIAQQDVQLINDFINFSNSILQIRSGALARSKAIEKKVETILKYRVNSEHLLAKCKYKYLSRSCTAMIFDNEPHTCRPNNALKVQYYCTKTNTIFKVRLLNMEDENGAEIFYFNPLCPFIRPPQS